MIRITGHANKLDTEIKVEVLSKAPIKASPHKPLKMLFTKRTPVLRTLSVESIKSIPRTKEFFTVIVVENIIPGATILKCQALSNDIPVDAVGYML